MADIPFNTPFLTGKEVDYIYDAYANGQLAGDGKYTKLSSELLQSLLQVRGCLLTHSCTAALEMAAILLDVRKGDEIILPSYTFVSTANAFVLRGAVPVFVDVDPKTFNIDPMLVNEAITPSTKAIVAVHYAGVSCDMDRLMTIAASKDVPVVEDAAHAFGSNLDNKNGIMSSFFFINFSPIAKFTVGLRGIKSSCALCMIAFALAFNIGSVILIPAKFSINVMIAML